MSERERRRRLGLRSPRPSKSRLDQVCFKLQRDVTILQREVASLRAALRPKTAAIDSEEAAAREAAKQKRIEDRETARREYAEAAAKQAIIQPEKDRVRAEWLAKEAARKRDLHRSLTRKWKAANPEKVRASQERWKAANPERVRDIQARGRQRRREAKAARKQIEARPELLGGAP